MGGQNGADTVILGDSGFYTDDEDPRKYLPGTHTCPRAALSRGYPLGHPALLSSSWPGTEKRIRAYCLSLGLEWCSVFCIQLLGQKLSCCCTCNSLVSREKSVSTLTSLCFTEILGGQGFQPTWGLVLVAARWELITEVLREGPSLPRDFTSLWEQEKGEKPFCSQ